MTPDFPILVIGGTRGTGLLTARLLLQRGFPVRVLARNPEAAARRLPHPAEIVRGDITESSTLPAAIRGARHIIFTAGCRSGRPVRESEVRRTEYDGVANTLSAARDVGFDGRFLYMTSSGVHGRSFWTFVLNTYKGNTLRWRARAETLIRESGLSFTIIRTGVLNNSPGGRHRIRISDRELPLSPRHRIARADVAHVFVAAMDDPAMANRAIEAVWWSGPIGPDDS